MSHIASIKKSENLLLSYLSAKEKHALVGSFVIENFWDTFTEENAASIKIFREIAKKSIQHFIEVYQDVWDYVIQINLLDDHFLINTTKANVTEGVK